MGVFNQSLAEIEIFRDNLVNTLAAFAGTISITGAILELNKDTNALFCFLKVNSVRHVLNL